MRPGPVPVLLTRYATLQGGSRRHSTRTLTRGGASGGAQQAATIAAAGATRTALHHRKRCARIVVDRSTAAAARQLPLPDSINTRSIRNTSSRGISTFALRHSAVRFPSFGGSFVATTAYIESAGAIITTAAAVHRSVSGPRGRAYSLGTTQACSLLHPTSVRLPTQSPRHFRSAGRPVTRALAAGPPSYQQHCNRGSAGKRRSSSSVSANMRTEVATPAIEETVDDTSSGSSGSSATAAPSQKAVGSQSDLPLVPGTKFLKPSGPYQVRLL